MSNWKCLSAPTLPRLWQKLRRHVFVNFWSSDEQLKSNWCLLEYYQGQIPNDQTVRQSEDRSYMSYYRAILFMDPIVKAVLSQKSKQRIKNYFEAKAANLWMVRSPKKCSDWKLVWGQFVNLLLLSLGLGPSPWPANHQLSTSQIPPP